jgi:quercetin dioxygenase-like cupin family protein
MVEGLATQIRPAAFEVTPGAGEHLSMAAIGHEFWIKAPSERTGGSFSLTESTTAPGKLVGWHVHDAEDEAFYVLDGEYRFTVGGDELLARAGGLIFIPRGAPHTFTVGPRGGGCLTIFTPGGYEDAFRRIGAAIERGELTPEFWGRLGAEHRTRFLDEAEVDAVGSPRGFVATPETSERIEWPGARLTVLAAADQTGGSLTLIHNNSDAFTIPWHVHEDDELFYVLEGRYGVRCGEHAFEGGPGTVFFLPRNVPHEQSVLTDGARKLMLVAPGGMEGFFRGLAQTINDATITPERRREIARRNRMRFLEDDEQPRRV